MNKGETERWERQGEREEEVRGCAKNLLTRNYSVINFIQTQKEKEKRQWQKGSVGGYILIAPDDIQTSVEAQMRCVATRGSLLKRWY